jgi:hypothetical protein
MDYLFFSALVDIAGRIDINNKTLSVWFNSAIVFFIFLFLSPKWVLIKTNLKPEPNYNLCPILVQN